jgi:hypothetical protein
VYTAPRVDDPEALLRRMPTPRDAIRVGEKFQGRVARTTADLKWSDPDKGCPIRAELLLWAARLDGLPRYTSSRFGPVVHFLRADRPQAIERSDVPQVKLVTIAIAALLLPVSSQRDAMLSREPSFVLDSTKPYVYVELQSKGPRIPRSPDEPSDGYFFLLKNNCQVPIVVPTFGVPRGSSKYEIGLLDDVVADASATPTVRFYGPHQRVDRQEHEPLGKMPSGYSYHARSTATLKPGETVLFSLPQNHISKRWHAEIRFEFALPSRNSRNIEQKVKIFWMDLE